MQAPGRIFVTGGNGFLGSQVVRLLCEEGWTVCCLLRPSSCTGRIDDLPVERAIGDVRDLASLESATKDCAGVIHLASVAGWDAIASPTLDAVIVGGTRNVLAAARSAGGLRVVIVSSAAAINGTDHPVVRDESAEFCLDPRLFAYAAAKKRAEALAIEAAGNGLPAVIVNPAEVYGPDDIDLVTSANLLQWIHSRPAFVVRGGTSIAHVEDVARGTIAAFHRGRAGERYFLGGENVTLRNLARLTLDLAGMPRRRIVTIPTCLARTSATLAMRYRLPFPVPPALIPYATKYWFFSADKAGHELGARFRPAIDVLRPTIEWLRDSGRMKVEG